jgi:general secretion pathway protein J
MRRCAREQHGWSDQAGFTLIEALVSTVLMVVILGALAVIMAQWMPNWNRGFAHVQQTEHAADGLERIVADLAAAEFIPPTDTRAPLFDGSPLSVIFVRSALGPNTRPGLEFVRIAETADDRGLAMVRMRARFVPLPAAALGQVNFTDPVVLVRVPYRVSFAYAGVDRIWRDNWRGATTLPTAVRVTLRDAASAEVLTVSTAALVHVDAPADCVSVKDPKTCGVENVAKAE